MYIVNYGDNDGWQILSSDARTPAVIAYGDQGRFSLEDGSPAAQVWMECMAADIAAVKRARDEELNFSKEEISANRAKWGKGDTRDLYPPEDDGYWVTHTSSQVIVTDSLNHMTPHWDQNEPYNAYCPFRNDIIGVRALAGCVAVAASEVLYYLHGKWGVPATMVDSGYCIGSLPNHDQSFSGTSSTIWSQMDTLNHGVSQPANAEALMIGHVGKTIEMNYNNGYSWSFPAKIRTMLFPLYNISCSHGSYDASAVISNLENRLPVIVTATNLLVPLDWDIHCFVIDGYKKAYTSYSHYHYWVPDTPNTWEIDPDHEPYFTYSQTTPEITAIKINWGWKNQWNEAAPINDGWYSLTPCWLVDNGGLYTYNYYVSMIYNLSIQL